jgi:hypothetical protein
MSAVRKSFGPVHWKAEFVDNLRREKEDNNHQEVTHEIVASWEGRLEKFSPTVGKAFALLLDGESDSKL